MLEALLILFVVIACGWLLLSAVWFVVKLLLWTVIGTLSLAGSALLLVLLLPLALLLGLALVPVMLIGLIPLALPMAIVGTVLWLLLRDRRTPSRGYS